MTKTANIANQSTQTNPGSSGNLDLNVEIQKFRPSTVDIQDYIAAQRGAIKTNPKAHLTLNQYLKEKYFKDSNTVVVADLSDRTFGRDGTDKITDLVGADFAGSYVRNTSFTGCDLSEAVFCDVDLDNAYFKNTKLTNIDFTQVGKLKN